MRDFFENNVFHNRFIESIKLRGPMNNNSYLNFILTVAALAVIVFGFSIVSSVDNLRNSVDAVSRQISQIEKTPARNAAAASKGKISTPAAEDKSAKMANSEFYAKDAQSGGAYISATMADTKNMNSMINNDSFISTLWSYANDRLAERNYKSIEKFEAQLADSWSISEDKLVYTIKIKKGVLWHDFTDPVSGKEWKDVEVKAQDFKFYVDVIKDVNTDCAPMRTYLQALEKVEVINDYEFKVYWNKLYFQSEEITLGLSPLPRHLYYDYEEPFDGKKFNDDHQRNRIIVGCGPYRFDRWDKGQRIIMKRWDKYYGTAYGVNPALTYLVFDVIKLENTRLQALISNTINSVGLTPEQWVMQTSGKEFQEGGPLKKFKYQGMSYSYIGYNQKNALFNDKRVRQALTYLVDKERILKDVYLDLGRITTGPYFIDGPYYDKSIKPYEYSHEKAEKLLKEAGWEKGPNGILMKDGKKFEFTILAVSGHPLQPKILGIVQQSFEKAGISMKIQLMEWSVFLQKIEKKNFDACILGWTTGLSPDSYQIWHSSQADMDASSNHISFKNPEADRIIEEIRVTFDLQKRIELCHKFHRLLNEEQPYTFLISPFVLQGINTKFRNVKIFPLGLPTEIIWLPEEYQTVRQDLN